MKGTVDELRAWGSVHRSRLHQQQPWRWAFSFPGDPSPAVSRRDALLFAAEAFPEETLPGDALRALEDAVPAPAA